MKFEPGEHVKFQVKCGESGEAEWMWLLVDHCDDDQRLVFGTLDNQPVVTTQLKVGQQLAVSYDNVREHRRF